MLDTLVMLVAEEAFDAIFIFEVDIAQDWITFYEFVKNAEIQRQFIYTFNAFYQLSAYWTPYTVVVEQNIETFGAERVPAMYQYSRYFFTDIEISSAIIAKMKSSALIICSD